VSSVDFGTHNMIGVLGSKTSNGYGLSCREKSWRHCKMFLQDCLGVTHHAMPYRDIEIGICKRYCKAQTRRA
jgi:hypothetical protein